MTPTSVPPLAGTHTTTSPLTSCMRTCKYPSTGSGAQQSFFESYGFDCSYELIVF